MQFKIIDFFCSHKRFVKFLLAVVIAIHLGLLEAAWTTPTAPGATKAGLGNFAIAVIMVIVCFPWVWWAFGLSMLEEFIQVWIGNEGNWVPNWDWLFHHWSAGYFGVNLYPVITFPLISILIECGYWLFIRYSKHS